MKGCNYMTQAINVVYLLIASSIMCFAYDFICQFTYKKSLRVICAFGVAILLFLIWLVVYFTLEHFKSV